MAINKFTIKGRVIDPETGQGIPGLQMEAWDKDLIFDDLLGSAATDADGFFEMQFDENYFKELLGRVPDLYFKIKQQGELLDISAAEMEVILPSGRHFTGTGETLLWKLAPGETQITLKLGIPVFHPRCFGRLHGCAVQVFRQSQDRGRQKTDTRRTQLLPDRGGQGR